VFEALKKRYDIIHYVGHAVFDPNNQSASALVLKDRNWSGGNIYTASSFAWAAYVYYGDPRLVFRPVAS
jgi:CHAT domain-containing protein